MKLAEIAARIHVHLKRIEADPKLNPYRAHDSSGWRLATEAERQRGEGIRWFFGARASATGRYVSVKYISYQSSTSLSKEEAERYLAWLDAGNIGKHYEALGR